MNKGENYKETLWTRALAAFFDNQSITAYLFISPAFFLLLIFSIFPIVYVIYISFTNYNLLKVGYKLVGFANYTKLFGNSLFWGAMRNTAYYVLGFVPLNYIFALALALLLNQKVKLRGFFRASYYIPVVTSMVVIAFLWKIVYSSAGPLNYSLGLFGIPPQKFLNSVTQALPSIIVTSVWQSVGFNMILFLAALQTIPPELYEAAIVDGASRWKQFRYITLPLLKGISTFIIIMSTMGAFRVFTEIYMMTQGGPARATTTIVYKIYTEAFGNFNLGYASAMSMILFLLIIVLTLIQLEIRARSD